LPVENPGVRAGVRGWAFRLAQTHMIPSNAALVQECWEPLLVLPLEQLERLYDYAAARAGDLDQLEQIAAGYVTREAIAVTFQKI
jgi:hypothetical protein